MIKKWTDVHFLSLQPLISKILEMFKPLNELPYKLTLSYNDIDVFVKDFSKFLLHFVQSQLEIYKESIQQVV